MALGQNAQAIGPSTTAKLFGTVTIGFDTVAYDNAVAIGNTAITRFSGTATALTSGIGSAMEMGVNAVAIGANTVAIGTASRARSCFAFDTPSNYRDE